MEISNSSIIITGAASGFGKAMSLYFSSQGAKVYALDIDRNSLTKLKDEGENKILVFNCDVANNNEVESTIDTIFEVDKSINVLINNAGIMKNAPLVNLLERPDSRHSIELWGKVIEINQNGVFYMTRSVINKMVKNRNIGVVVNISSISAKGNSGQTAYAASKAAVEAMSKVWAKEFGSFGIRSVSIAPGFINTKGAHDALEEKMLSQWVTKTPLRRTGTVDEVVSAVKFVIENDFVNGEVINVNGGLVL
jgi:3-oxoacyl-[acyl-carrier protein] reductase